ncbi:MAG TPA: hypothetical protein VHZ96_03355 [Frankiaceae bacterium]|jgi:hypothetical protein|nr:hypothetical protein [Frankiaceae bacterium]
MKLAHEGLAVTTPRGWDARIFKRQALAGEVTLPVMHAADFPLPAVRGDYGGGAVEIMGPDHVFLSLIEFDQSEATTPLFGHERPSRITSGEFGPDRLQRALPGQGGAQFFFVERGRPFCLYVVIGSYDGRTSLVPKANEIFQTMEVN